ncbi:MAG: alpha/beta hydrolase [Aquisalinus sp.]|nr:alpha/beta hydrolase [Aquisalinus sp.]
MIRNFLFGFIGTLVVIWAALILWPEGQYTPHEPDEDYKVRAAEYLATNLTPMPESWQWSYFTAEDGKKMRWGTASPEGDLRGTVIFVPGYTGALEMYADYHHDLLRRGYEVYGFDLRGQGGSDRMLTNPEKPWVSDFGVYSDDIAGFVRQVRAETQGPLVLVGESFGGHVVLRASGDHDLPIDGLVLAVPAMRIQTAPLPYGVARLLVEGSRKLGFGKDYALMQKNWQPYRTDLTQPNYCGDTINRVHVKDTLYTARPELRVGGTTNQWIAEIMESGEMVSKPGYLGRLDMPVLLVSGDTDSIVQKDVSIKACKAHIPDCEVLILKNSGHCTISEPAETRLSMFDGVESLFARIEAAQ